MTAVVEYFERYEEGANSFDPDLMSSLYTKEFLAGDPNGVLCGRNDEVLRDSFSRRKEFFRQIGFKRARILDVDAKPLDDRYTMAKVHWHMVFEKDPGHPLEFKFFITYFLYDSGSGPKAAFWISHDDERQVMQDAGLLAAEA